MDRPEFFAFYPADFANDLHVEAMSTLQLGAYMLLLCKAWQGDPPGSLPNDDQILARYARLDAATWEAVKLGVLAPLRIGVDGRLHSKRLRAEFDNAVLRMKTNRERAKVAGKARWDRAKDAPSNASSMLQASVEQCLTDATEKENKRRQNTEEPPLPPAKPGGQTIFPRSLDSPGFRAVWAEWLAFRKSKRKPVSDLAAKQQLAALEPLGESLAIECIQSSVRNDYQGLFPDRFKPKLSLFATDRAAATDARIVAQIQEATQKHD